MRLVVLRLIFFGQVHARANFAANYLLGDDLVLQILLVFFEGNSLFLGLFRQFIQWWQGSSVCAFRPGA